MSNGDRICNICGNYINNHVKVCKKPMEKEYFTIESKEELKQMIKEEINNYTPFISEVEEFNELMGKGEANQKIPTISDKKIQDFVYNFLLEELNEYKESCEKEDIVGIADALGDIMYVLCNGILAHGLKDKFTDIYGEIQKSNLSKLCKTEKEAIDTVEFRSKEKQEIMHFEKHGDYWIVYRSRDKKVQKSLLYTKPDLKKFFS